MPSTPNDYRYDVFFSYKRHSLTLDWVRAVVPRLRYWLTEELGGRREAEIFFDESCIEAGDRWPDALRAALGLSRCMVGVWAPSYFHSRWCLSEWRSFLERERLTERNTRGLIAPLRFHDGEHFPEEARTVQWVDVAPYTSTLPAFWNSAKALEFEDSALRPFARTLL